MFTNSETSYRNGTHNQFRAEAGGASVIATYGDGPGWHLFTSWSDDIIKVGDISRDEVEKRIIALMRENFRSALTMLARLA